MPSDRGCPSYTVVTRLTWLFWAGTVRCLLVLRSAFTLGTYVGIALAAAARRPGGGNHPRGDWIRGAWRHAWDELRCQRQRPGRDCGVQGGIAAPGADC